MAKLIGAAKDSSDPTQQGPLATLARGVRDLPNQNRDKRIDTTVQGTSHPWPFTPKYFRGNGVKEERG